MERGIVVDSHMRTSHPDAYAVGDAVQVDIAPHRHPCLQIRAKKAVMVMRVRHRREAYR